MTRTCEQIYDFRFDLWYFNIVIMKVNNFEMFVLVDISDLLILFSIFFVFTITGFRFSLVRVFLMVVLILKSICFKLKSILKKKIKK